MIRAKWIRFINGSSIAFKELYDLYIDELFSYGISIHGNKDLVMDCIHDLFIDLFDNPRMAQDVNVKYYLLASLKRRIIKRKQETRQVGSLQELPENLKISWENLKPIFEDLLQKDIRSVEDLERWLKQRSELEAVLQEDYAWRYIHMTRHTANEDYKNAFEYFTVEIEPKLSDYDNKLDKKFIACPFLQELDPKKYTVYIKRVKQSLDIFRNKNIPLFKQITTRRNG